MIILFFQLVLIVGFSFSFYNYVQKEVQPVDVFVYNKDLDVNTQITASDITKVSVPSKAVTKDFALDPKEVVGKYVQTQVFANQFVYDKQLVDEGETDPFESMDLAKLRKISLPISYVEGFGGNISRGDKVDLVFTGQGTKQDETGMEQTFRYSKVFLQDVYVYGVTTDDGYQFQDRTQTSGVVEDETEQIDTTSSSSELAVLTLAVTLEQAEEIRARMSSGEVSFLSRFDDNESYETLGFVLGDYEKVFSAPANAETGRTTINNGN